MEPKTLQRIQTEVCKQAAEDYDAALHRSRDEGWIIWASAPPRQRLQGYRTVTFPQDVGLVLTPDYVKLYRQGAAPELTSVQYWRAWEESGVAIPPEAQPYFHWALLLLLPDWVFEDAAADFRRLAQAEEQRQERV